MDLKAGFAAVDITPSAGTRKIGWLRNLTCETVLDPLFARIAVFEARRERIAFIALDTLCVRWTTVRDIRRCIERATGFPGANIMVAATHNHAGPAVANVGEVARDGRYVAGMVRKVAAGFDRAWRARRSAMIGMASSVETRVAHNRRVVLRDGRVCTHGVLQRPESLYIEGPVDPELAVIAVKSDRGAPLGLIVNYACHPTHHGGTGEISAGYPGRLAAAMAARGWPVTLFLNGACGNLHDADPAEYGKGKSKDMIGAMLAENVDSIIGNMPFARQAALRARGARVDLPFRKAPPIECKGAIPGAQRFVRSDIYDRCLVPQFLARLKRMPAQPAEVQVLSIGDRDFVGIPAEYFVENGLKIKTGANPRHALVVSCANGMVGYVPHAAAFQRGGYETTLGDSSRLAPEAGDILADTAIELIKK